ncbi:MAG TPA: class I SAM-dependent methyltransferase [Terriglobia bacterium]|nr:class I SAM-dependent methyltransferase [Terriglobia bacterium]
MEPWFDDWSHIQHAEHFDGRSKLRDRDLQRDFECLNDVRLLNERIRAGSGQLVLEIGCATGEFYRYLRMRHPGLAYFGIDISEPAVARARDKFPQGRFFVTQPEWKISDVLMKAGLTETPQTVYAKDVVHHQTRPLEFVTDLVTCASKMTIMRCRTKDRGGTEWDPEKSCQYHYSGWMPYIVTNLSELIDHIRSLVPKSEIVVWRNYMVLGGRHNRYLPKDCYLKETGTAETAVGVFVETEHPGKITIQDRPDANPSYTLTHFASSGLRFLVRRVWR